MQAPQENVMHKRLWLLLPIVILSGCRIVSQQELADLKNPPNPKMANIAQTWQSETGAADSARCEAGGGTAECVEVRQRF